MKFYAQLNENNICTGVSQLSGEVSSDSMVEIEVVSDDYLWRKYENGQWSANKFEPSPSPAALEPTNAEIKANQLVIMEVLATMYEEMLAKGTV